jgi:hypothetical protein
MEEAHHTATMARTKATAMYRRYSRRPFPPRAFGQRSLRPLRILLLVLAAAIVLGSTWTLVLAAMLLVMVLAIWILVTAVAAVAHVATAARPRRAPSRATVPIPAPRAKDWRVEWRAARRRFDALRAEYAGYECDPLAVLRLPALADVTVPSTARFVDAFAEAQSLHSEQEPPAEYAAAYLRAVDRAWQCWHAARDAAERIRLAGLSPEERVSVQRVIKLLTMAKDNDNDAERMAAYAKARTELAKLERTGRLHLPRQALASLDEASRAGLPAAPAWIVARDPITADRGPLRCNRQGGSADRP